MEKDKPFEFTARVLDELLTMPISEGLKIRVLAVEDDRLGTAVSIQHWWKGEDNQWHIGKGFKISLLQANELSRKLQSAVRRLKGDVLELTSTQRIKIVVEGDHVYLIKNWRKHRTQPWVDGKEVSFSLNLAKLLSRVLSDYQGSLELAI